MNQVSGKLGYWSAILLALLVILIDAGMIASAILYPMTSITSMQEYVAQFSSWQMLPLVPSFILAPVFVVFMLCIYRYASEDRKILGQLGVAFAVTCAAILSLHYYIQLTFVQQGILANDTVGLWQFAAPNPHSFFWTFAALGYGFMGFALLSTAQIFTEESEAKIRWLFVANGLVGTAFLVGNALGLFMVNIIASFVWGVLFPIASFYVARKFRFTKR